MNAAKRVDVARRRRRWPAVVGLLAAVASAAGAAGYLVWWPRELCRRWEARATAADDATAAAAVEGLDRCGPLAIRPLVGLLASARPAVADAAQAALAARIGRIRLAGADAWSDAADLAETLRAALPSAPPESQHRHVALSMALLEASGRLGLDFPTDEAARGRVMAACEIVLRQAPPAVEPARFVAEHAMPLKRPDRVRTAVRQAASQSATTQSDTTRSAATEPTTSEADLSQPTGPEGPQLFPPSPLPTSMPAAPLAPGDSAGAQTPQPAEALPRTAANAAARVNPIRKTSAGANPTTIESSAGPGATASQTAGDASTAAMLASRTAWSLFADLANGSQAGALAEAELHRRGFRPAELELGRRFASADPDQRARLAESLPLEADIDIRPWLVHLSEDAAPAVRLAAVTVMATTHDPQLLDRLRRMALTDADEQVRNRARKLSTR